MLKISASQRLSENFFNDPNRLRRRRGFRIGTLKEKLLVLDCVEANATKVVLRSTAGGIIHMSLIQQLSIRIRGGWVLIKYSSRGIYIRNSQHCLALLHRLENLGA